MGKRKELSKFSDIELIVELRERGLAVSALGPEDLEDVGVAEKERCKEFSKIRGELESVAMDAVDNWLSAHFEDILATVLRGNKNHERD